MKNLPITQKLGQSFKKRFFFFANRVLGMGVGWAGLGWGWGWGWLGWAAGLVGGVPSGSNSTLPVF